jgi:short-subunit dehydrogenase
LVAPPFVMAYTASKHAVVGLSLALRPEAALHGVRVSVLCPGAVDTPILDRGPDPDLPGTASKPITAREYLAVVRQKPVPADDVAHRALKAVTRNRAVIVVPASAKPLWYLHRCHRGWRNRSPIWLHVRSTASSSDHLSPQRGAPERR